MIRLVFTEKREFYLFYYDLIFKDPVLSNQIQSGIEIDVIVVKNVCLFKFCWKVCKIKVKNESQCTTI